MKTLKELRGNLDLNASELTSFVNFLKKQTIDWDVYLPSLGINLQREFVWELVQKREIIMSILLQRHIPKFSFVVSYAKGSTEEKYLIIDGKQRLSSIFDFIDDKFSIEIDDKEYLFSELPVDYQLAITKYPIRYHALYETPEKLMSDETKRSWFIFINFAGTPQDLEHLNKLSRTVKKDAIIS